MLNQSKNKNNYKIILIFVCLLLLISLLTKYYGSGDVGDYADVAKFFSGNYQAKLRTSHSIFYGLIHAPFVKLTNNFLFFKISSFLWFSLIILSLYYMSNKNKKTLLLILTSPIVWFMAPWISPIQLSSLLFLWGYYFIKKYDEKGKIKNLFYSALFLGLSWAFWDPIIYFSIFLAFCFLFNKKFSHFLLFFAALFVGSLPKLILEHFLFGFAFYSILKHLFAEISFITQGGIYFQELPSSSLLSIILTLLFIPFFSYLFFKKENFSKHKKTIIFLILSTIFIIIDAQIRLFLLIIPIIILILGNIINEKQFKIQILISLFLTILVVNPYLIQIKYEANAKEFSSFVKSLFSLELNSTFYNSLVQQDLNEIAKELPNQIFVVGNKPDDYQRVAHVYWGKEIKEFISIQDYELFLKNETRIAGKILCSASKSWNRRDICFSIELRKSINDNTDYNSIRYAISLDENLNLDNFKLIKKYKVLSVFEKKEGKWKT